MAAEERQSPPRVEETEAMARPETGAGRYPVGHARTTARCSGAGTGVHPPETAESVVGGAGPGGSQPGTGRPALLHQRVGRRSRQDTKEVTPEVVETGGRGGWTHHELAPGAFTKDETVIYAMLNGLDASALPVTRCNTDDADARPMGICVKKKRGNWSSIMYHVGISLPRWVIGMLAKW